MNFDEQLNAYLDELNCNSKDLADKSGISAPVISRFRNGKKVPNLNSSQLEQLSTGLFLISQEKGFNLTQKQIYSKLLSTFDDNIDIELLRQKFNEFVDSLNINITALANSMGFSVSLISKIRSGQRNPFNKQEFAQSVCTYIVNNHITKEDKNIISLLLKCPLEDLSDKKVYYNNLIKHLSSESDIVTDSIDNFLKHLDKFDLDEYIKTVHFDKIKVPYIPFYRPTQKKYVGIQEMKQGELDFFKATVLSKSTEPIFMYSDMPMEDMAEDVEFGKNWMLAIAMTLKKGLHLNIIHNLNRPFNEIMLGLESWIPIYMTGQVSPYYFKNFGDNIFCHFNYVSGTVALVGECIKGYHHNGRYTLLTNKYDLEYTKQKARNLLEIADPLMEIYKAEEKNKFDSFIMSKANNEGSRRRILPTLPIHTISKELLLKILKRNNVSSEDIENIIQSVEREKTMLNIILKNNIFIDEIEELSEADFNQNPQLLFLANSFYKNEISYNFSEYLEHLKLTKEFAENTNNYQLKINKNHPFNNIQIYIHDKEFVMISKNTSPTIHFVIYNLKLRNAIENFIPPIIE